MPLTTTTTTTSSKVKSMNVITMFLQQYSFSFFTIKQGRTDQKRYYCEKRRNNTQIIPPRSTSFYLCLCLLLLLSCIISVEVEAFVTTTTKITTAPFFPTTTTRSSTVTTTTFYSTGSIKTRTGNSNFKRNIVSLSSSTTSASASTSTSISTTKNKIINNKVSNNNSSISPFEWHKQRRYEMIQKYGTTIKELEQNTSSLVIGLPLLIITNVLLFTLSIYSGIYFTIPQVLAVAIFPGSILSLWQLQLLHDIIHDSFISKSLITNGIITIQQKKQYQHILLFIGSLPCIFGYYLYLKYGHISHHINFGKYTGSELIFDSSHKNFEDGDLLFVTHRMNTTGPFGPKLYFTNNNNNNNNDNKNDNLKNSADVVAATNGIGTMIKTKVLNLVTELIPSNLIGRSNDNNDSNNNNNSIEYIRMSIAKLGFHFWKEGEPIRNGLLFIISFLVERIMLSINDIYVAINGYNLFFPNKPLIEYHKDTTFYTRVAVTIRLLLLFFAGWKSLLFLYLCETLWSLPPHPACAMFITNHGSTESTIKNTNTNYDNTGVVSSSSSSCIPTKSTYSGMWYSLLTLGTNYHCEHHDFPTIPFHQLYKLQFIAPEYYPDAIGNKQRFSDNNNNNEYNNEQQESSNSNYNQMNLLQIMKQAFSYPEFYACMNSNVMSSPPPELLSFQKKDPTFNTLTK